MRNALGNLVPYSDKFSRTKIFADRPYHTVNVSRKLIIFEDRGQP